MRKIHLAKTAKALAILMALSILMPIMAFAAVGFEDFKYNERNRTVSSSVYFTEGEVDPADNATVQVGVYSPEGVYLGVIDATYNPNKTVNGTVYYDFFFDFTVGSAVYESVYFAYGDDWTDNAVRPDKPRRGGGGGGFFPPPAQVDGDVINVSGNQVSESALRQALQNHDHVTLKITGDYVLIPASVLAEFPDAVITVEAPAGTYTLPLSVFDFDALSEELDADLADMNIRVGIAQVSGDELNEVKEAAKAVNAELVGDAVDFTLAAEAGSESVDITDFGGVYVERTITVSSEVDAAKATGAVLDAEAGEMKFVPSIFSSEDSETTVTLKRTTNSIYAVVTKDPSFTDVPANHWAAEDIDVLTSKLIVFGMTESQFDLNRDITRAEFAGLVVRSLGLDTNGTTSTFSDVAADRWYAKEVAAAADAGIVYGYPDGTFRPNDLISRQELASMVVRAMEYAGKDVSITNAQANRILNAFNDVAEVGAWAKNEMALAIDAKVVYGMGNDKLSPRTNATRAQATAMLYRYLQDVDFIN